MRLRDPLSEGVIVAPRKLLAAQGARISTSQPRSQARLVREMSQRSIRGPTRKEHDIIADSIVMLTNGTLPCVHAVQ